MYLLILSILQFGIVIQAQETNNTEEEISDYCDAVAKDTSFKVNVTVSDINNKNYCVEGGSRVALFDTIQQEDQYVYLSEHYCANLQHYPITCEQYYHASEYDKKPKPTIRSSMKIIRPLEYPTLIVWVLQDSFSVLNNSNIAAQMMEIPIMKSAVSYVSFGKIDVLITVIFTIVFVLMEEEKMEDAVMQLTILFCCFHSIFIILIYYII